MLTCWLNGKDADNINQHCTKNQNFYRKVFKLFFSLLYNSTNNHLKKGLTKNNGKCLKIGSGKFVYGTNLNHGRNDTHTQQIEIELFFSYLWPLISIVPLAMYVSANIHPILAHPVHSHILRLFWSMNLFGG